MSTSDLNTVSAKLIVPKLLTIITGMSIALVLLTTTTVALSVFVFKKKIESFAVSESGRVIPIIPLDQPYVNDARITGFAEECLRGSFAHDYENFRLTMNSAKTCYTTAGARNFEAAMEPLLVDVRTKNVVLSASMEPTVVVKSYKLSGVVHWETETMMTLYRRGTREQLAPLKFVVTSVIERVALDESVRGISVRSINLKPMQFTS